MIHTCVQNRHSDSYSFLYQKSIVTFGVNELTEAEDWILAFQQLLNRIQQVIQCTVGKICNFSDMKKVSSLTGI